MPASPLLQAVDAVTVPVPDLDAGLAFYRDRLGHRLLWRHDELGQAGLALGTGETELVLTLHQGYAPTWLVASVDDAVAEVLDAGGRQVSEARDLPVGRVAVVADPFGNDLVVIELSRGRYVADEQGNVVGVRPGSVGGSV